MKVAFFCAEDFNLGASYVIAYLKSIGHKVRLFFDYDKTFTTSPQCMKELKEFNPDLFLLSCVTANYGWASQTAKHIQKNIPVARVVIGGVHPTLCPEDLKRDNLEFCEGDGIKYFGGNFDPDTLWADREIFLEQLPPVHRAYQIFMTGFGCPFRCSYCNNHQLHRKFYRRKPENCVEELSSLKKRGMKYVMFDDDIFTLDTNWLIDFFKYYSRLVALPFTCFGHVRFINDRVSRLLKENNCQCVWLGVQSGYEQTRKEILNRHETNDEIVKACSSIKKNNLKLMIDHIFGLPFDNYEKLLFSYEFYKKIKPDVVNCYELLYFPKAEINKYGSNQALYQRQGGQDFKRYAKSFASIPLLCN